MANDLADAVKYVASCSGSSTGPLLLHLPMMLAVGSPALDTPHIDGVTENRLKGQNADLGLSPSQKASELRRNLKKNVILSFDPVILAGAPRQPFAELFCALDSTRSETSTKVRLSLEHLYFGVKDCCTQDGSVATSESRHKSCKTVFIHKVEIRMRPKAGVGKCQLLVVKPHDESEAFAMQRNTAPGFRMTFPWQLTFTYQTGTTVCHTARTFGWGPATRDDASNAVSWAWEIDRYADGSKLEFNKTRWGRRPPLPIRPSHTHIGPGSMSVEASWDIDPDVELQTGPIEFYATVILHTAILQGKGRLLGHMATMGPTIPSEELPLAFL